MIFKVLSTSVFPSLKEYHYGFEISTNVENNRTGKVCSTWASSSERISRTFPSKIVNYDYICSPN